MEGELRHARGLNRTHFQPRKQLLRVPGEDALREIDVTPTPPAVDALLSRQPGWITYQDLALLQDASPELAEEAWARIRTAARAEIASGHYAGGMIEDPGTRQPYGRALFLEVRQGLVDEWQPRGMSETLLIDNMAQALVMRQRWMARTVSYAEPPDADLVDRMPDESEEAWRQRQGEHEARQRRELYLPPRVTQAEAVDRAAGMIERFDRLFLRNLRALRDLRRHAVVIHNAPGGQVNLAGQQVNLSAPPPLPTE